MGHSSKIVKKEGKVIMQRVHPDHDDYNILYVTNSGRTKFYKSAYNRIKAEERFKELKEMKNETT